MDKIQKLDFLVNIKNLSVSYEKQYAIEKVNFKIKKGEYIAIVGPNGSGKTTLIKSILGLVTPTSGNIEFSKKIKIGYLPQKVIQQDKFFPATINEVVAMGYLSNKKFPKILNKTEKKEIDVLLKDLGIYEQKNKKIGTLSGGQQQRVLLARTLINRPELLILDEPTSALDASMRNSFYKLIEMLNKQGITVVIISHDVASIGEYVSRIIYMDEKILFDGNFEDFCENSELTPYIHTHKSNCKGVI